MQGSEIRELNDQELQDRIGELQEERFRLRLRAATQALEQPHRLRDLRRDIARMKTVLAERRLGINVSKATETGKKTASPTKRTGKTKRSGAKQSARRGRA